MDLFRLELDDEEDHVPHGSKHAQCLNTEEVPRIQRLPVRVHQLLPGALLLSLRGGDDACFVENTGDGGAADVDTESNADSISDLRLSPGEILVG